MCAPPQRPEVGPLDAFLIAKWPTQARIRGEPQGPWVATSTGGIFDQAGGKPPIVKKPLSGPVAKGGQRTSGGDPL